MTKTPPIPPLSDAGVQCKICAGNPEEYALLRGVNGSRMNIMAH